MIHQSRTPGCQGPPTHAVAVPSHFTATLLWPYYALHYIELQQTQFIVQMCRKRWMRRMDKLAIKCARPSPLTPTAPFLAFRSCFPSIRRIRLFLHICTMILHTKIQYNVMHNINICPSCFLSALFQAARRSHCCLAFKYNILYYNIIHYNII